MASFDYEAASPTAAGVAGDKTGNKTLDRATNLVQDAYTWTNMRLEGRRRDFARRYAQYRGNMNVFGRDTIQTQLRSQIWIPKSGSLVETVIPRTLGDNPDIEVRGRKPDYAEAAKLMEPLLEYYCTEMGFFESLYFWWKDALIYGTGIVKVIWSYKEEIRKVGGDNLIAKMGSEKALFSDEEADIVVVEDIPRMINVDIMDFFFDYTASSIDKMDFCIEKYELPYDLVQARLKQGYYAGITEGDLAAYVSASRELQEDSHYKDERDRAAYGFLGNEGESIKNRIDQLKKIVCYDYWGRADVNGDGRDENVLITCIGERASKAVRAVYNPYEDGHKPYVSANYMPVHNDFLGIGLMEWTEQLQREMNTRYNMGVDNANFILNAMVLVRRSANIPDAQLKSRPSGRIDVNEPDDVTPLTMPVIFDKLIQNQQLNDQLWQDTTGISSEVAGVRKAVGSAFHRTAGGIYALQQAADSKLKMSRLLFEERSVKRVASLLVSRIKQFMDKAVTVPMVVPEGVQYVEIPPYKVNFGDYDVKFVIAPVEQIGKMAEREKWAGVLATLRQADPQMALFEWGNIYTDWMEGTGLPNPQRYLGNMVQKLEAINQLNIINQMNPMGPEGGPPPIQVGGGSPGGGGQQKQMEKQFAGQGAANAQKTSGGERGRAAQ